MSALGLALGIGIQNIREGSALSLPGAMIYVVVEKLVPGAQEHKNTDIATGEFMDGFLIMMLLDTTLG